MKRRKGKAVLNFKQAQKLYLRGLDIYIQYVCGYQIYTYYVINDFKKPYKNDFMVRDYFKREVAYHKGTRSVSKVRYGVLKCMPDLMLAI